MNFFSSAEQRSVSDLGVLFPLIAIQINGSQISSTFVSMQIYMLVTSYAPFWFHCGKTAWTLVASNIIIPVEIERSTKSLSIDNVNWIERSLLLFEMIRVILKSSECEAITLVIEFPVVYCDSVHEWTFNRLSNDIRVRLINREWITTFRLLYCYSSSGVNYSRILPHANGTFVVAVFGSPRLPDF